MKERILITGSKGFIGKNLVNYIKDSNYNNYDVVTFSSRDYDLSNSEEVKRLFKDSKPDYVIHLAAFVGGIEFSLNNSVMQ